MRPLVTRLLLRRDNFIDFRGCRITCGADRCPGSAETTVLPAVSCLPLTMLRVRVLVGRVSAFLHILRPEALSSLKILSQVDFKECTESLRLTVWRPTSLHLCLHRHNKGLDRTEICSLVSFLGKRIMSASWTYCGEECNSTGEDTQKGLSCLLWIAHQRLQLSMARSTAVRIVAKRARLLILRRCQDTATKHKPQTVERH